MNPEIHAQISVERWGGEIDDYYPIHFFMDSTKEFCSDNRHRVLHTLWAVRRIVIPIFGKTIINTAGKKVNVKDICERDHILPDYQNRFIPTLSDFIRNIDAGMIPDWQQKIETIHQVYADAPAIRTLLLSPLASTGKVESLLLTHNSWFLTDILPRIFPVVPHLINYEISPSDLFENMKFSLWMDNGTDIPPSARNLEVTKLD